MGRKVIDTPIRGTGCVLLIEDDPAETESLSFILKGAGYRVLTAPGVNETHELIRQYAREIDGIILDIELTDSLDDGYDLCVALREPHSVTAHIPVVVVSAHSTRENVDRSYSAGAFQHIRKPFQIDSLLAVIGSMIRMKKAQDQVRHSEEALRAIFNALPVGIFILGPDHVVTQFNPALVRSFPHIRMTPGAKEYEAFYDPPRTAPLANHPAYGALATREPQSAVMEVLVSGRKQWWDISAAPNFDIDGNLLNVVVMIRDVTRDRELAQQLKEEIAHARRAEEQARIETKRHKATLARQDEFADNLMNTQRDLRKKSEELEQANRLLADMNFKLERLSTIDELTQLSNRRHFQEIFPREVHRAMRYHHHISVLMMDIDHFKNINDRYLHQAGDEVLRLIGRVLTGQLRETDFVARYGGEEFVALLPETPEAEAHRIAERIRAAVEQSRCRYGEHDLQVTISIGFTTAHGEMTDPDILISDADSALYKAKQLGRNRVISFREL